MLRVCHSEWHTLLLFISIAKPKIYAVFGSFFAALAMDENPTAITIAAKANFLIFIFIFLFQMLSSIGFSLSHAYPK